MSPLFVPLAIVYVLLCIGLITIILMQKKRQAGFGAGLTGMSSSGGSFLDKNKANTKEGQLEKYSKIGGALFFLLSIALGLLA
ncbi:MAG: preprotein translocase subunit SecG [Defluviitaleaceae bacterium]|nr:preprotein translocase subunit SecG [Defluviitaleaceae bacterium]